MEKVFEHAPAVVDVLGACMMWVMKALLLVLAFAFFVGWNTLRVFVMILLCNRLPRSMVKAFD